MVVAHELLLHARKQKSGCIAQTIDFGYERPVANSARTRVIWSIGEAS
jgi:hypothetical protein